MKSILSYYRTERIGDAVGLKHFKAQHARIIWPEKSLRLVQLSPAGFDYGRDSRGAAQLALAILLDFTGNRDVSLTFYQDFKREHVATWQDERITIKGKEIVAWLNRKVEHGSPAAQPREHSPAQGGAL